MKASICTRIRLSGLLILIGSYEEVVPHWFVRRNLGLVFELTVADLHCFLIDHRKWNNRGTSRCFTFSGDKWRLLFAHFTYNQNFASLLKARVWYLEHISSQLLHQRCVVIFGLIRSITPKWKVSLCVGTVRALMHVPIAKTKGSLASRENFFPENTCKMFLPAISSSKNTTKLWTKESIHLSMILFVIAKSESLYLKFTPWSYTK